MLVHCARAVMRTVRKTDARRVFGVMDIGNQIRRLLDAIASCRAGSPMTFRHAQSTANDIAGIGQYSPSCARFERMRSHGRSLTHNSSRVFFFDVSTRCAYRPHNCDVFTLTPPPPLNAIPPQMTATGGARNVRRVQNRGCAAHMYEDPIGSTDTRRQSADLARP